MLGVIKGDTGVESIEQIDGSSEHVGHRIHPKAMESVRHNSTQHSTPQTRKPETGQSLIHNLIQSPKT